MSQFLTYEKNGHVVTLTMNQPETRNALTGNTAVDELCGAAARIAADRGVRAVILTGGGAAFSSGGNVKDMLRFADEAVDQAMIRQEYRHGIQRMTLTMVGLEVPLIAAVNGPAYGAGLDLACMCDIRIAAEEAVFAESFVKVGIVPGDGGAWLLPRIVGISRASEMALTGRPIDARKALEWGLVSRVTPKSELMAAANEIAGQIAENPGSALRMTKRLLREAQTERLESVLEMSAALQAIAHKSKDHREAVSAFIDKRKPVFTDD